MHDQSCFIDVHFIAVRIYHDYLIISYYPIYFEMITGYIVSVQVLRHRVPDESPVPLHHVQSKETVLPHLGFGLASGQPSAGGAGALGSLKVAPGKFGKNSTSLVVPITYEMCCMIIL